MPVLEKLILPENAVLGIWDIKEEIDFLLSALDLSLDEKNLFDSFVNDVRRKHWLSYRNLLKHLISKEEYIPLVYDENGKPHFTDKSHFLSVSHTGNVSAAIVSSSFHVGIDIEIIHPRIEKIVNKFLSNFEKTAINIDHRLEMLYIYWSAKEALYKMYGKRNLLFIENMTIAPFQYNCSGGKIKGVISTESFNYEFDLCYRKVDEYMLVYVVDKDNYLSSF
jgi:4'-phosphopantetheinyl transferase